MKETWISFSGFGSKDGTCPPGVIFLGAQTTPSNGDSTAVKNTGASPSMSPVITEYPARCSDTPRAVGGRPNPASPKKPVSLAGRNNLDDQIGALGDVLVGRGVVLQLRGGQRRRSAKGDLPGTVDERGDITMPAFATFGTTFPSAWTSVESTFSQVSPRRTRRIPA